MSSTRTPYSSDVSDDELAFVAPYLVLLAEDGGQRRYPLREVFNGLRYIVRTGAHWRMLPHDLPPWPVVYQQTRRWLAAGGCQTLVAVPTVQTPACRSAGPWQVRIDGGKPGMSPSAFAPRRHSRVASSWHRRGASRQSITQRWTLQSGHTICGAVPAVCVRMTVPRPSQVRRHPVLNTTLREWGLP